MANTNQDAVNRAGPNTLADAFRLMGLGDLLATQTTQTRRKENMDTNGSNSENLATVDVITLPAGAKATSIVRATVRAGGVTGELAPDLYGVTPGTGEVAVTPNGDIATLATDAITDMDVVYLGERGDVIVTTFPVVPGTGVLTIPPSIVARGVVLLAAVNVLEGTTTGTKIILIPASSAPATTNARLSLAKDVVHFAVADAVTRAQVTLVVAASADPVAFLEADESLI